ncbi:hypothetical protein VRB50_14465 [Pseudomonas poae]|uniref:hypothetical protein n=1 Tax=Pseudomonas poae TaxID=200451 RepID=UPI0030CFA218
MSELTTLHDAITRVISESMPKVVHVEQFPELGAEVMTPALLYGITDMAPGQDRGRGKRRSLVVFNPAFWWRLTAKRHHYRPPSWRAK